jgi:glycine C-acetyltransferase
MTAKTINRAFVGELNRLKEAKTFKSETLINSPQGAVVRVNDDEVVILASNNHLGLASDPRIIDAANRGIREFGYGVSSVRFICGTLTIHRQLEEAIAAFLGTPKTVFCFRPVIRRTKRFLHPSSRKGSEKQTTRAPSTAIG